MAGITTCTKCGTLYEAASEEAANHPSERLCRGCAGEAAIECPECGGTIATFKALLGGRVAAWHSPARASAATFAKGQCLFSGTVLNEPNNGEKRYGTQSP